MCIHLYLPKNCNSGFNTPIRFSRSHDFYNNYVEKTANFSFYYLVIKKK